MGTIRGLTSLGCKGEFDEKTFVKGLGVWVAFPHNPWSIKNVGLILFIYFRERGGEGERKGKKH